MSSWTDPDTYTPVAYMRDMFKLLDSLGKKRVVVVGTSMGGIIAMLMTAAKPDAIQGVVLNDVGPEVTQEGLDKIKNYIGKNRYFSSWEGAEVFCKAQYGAGFPDYVNDDWKRFARRLYCESEPSDTDNGEKSTDKISLNYDPELDNVVKNSAESTVPKELWSLYAALDVKPLLIVRGENSDILSAECVDKMLSGRSHDISLTVDVRNRAHAPMLDEPDCIRSLDVFLKRVSEYSPAKKKAQTAEA